MRDLPVQPDGGQHLQPRAGAVSFPVMGQPARGQVLRHLPEIFAPAFDDPGAAQGLEAAHMRGDEALRIRRDLLCPGEAVRSMSRDPDVTAEACRRRLRSA